MREMKLKGWIQDEAVVSRCEIDNWPLYIHHSENAEIGELLPAIFRQEGMRRCLEKPIHIWYNQDLDKYYRIRFEEIVSGLQPRIPDCVTYFYRTLQIYGVDHIPLEKHCNRYYEKDGLIFIDFPYASDNFFVVCDIEYRSMGLYGPAACVGRVLMDLMAVVADTYPVHGSSIVKNGYADCFLGNTKHGKSTARSYFMRQGYQSLADDMLFLRDECVIPVGDTTDDELTDAVPIGDIYILHRDWKIPFVQWFPCVAKQSVWWLIFTPYSERLEQSMNEKMARSVKLIHRLVKRAKHVTLDIEHIMNDRDYDIFKEMK